MGLFKSWSAVNVYIDALARFGIDSKAISSDLSGRVCKYTCEAVAEHTGLRQGDVLDFKIRRSAALVAMCILGPSEFRKFRPERHDISEATVSAAAASFRKGGRSAAALDVRIIHAVADAGVIHHGFTELYCRLSAEGSGTS